MNTIRSCNIIYFLRRILEEAKGIRMRHLMNGASSTLKKINKAMLWSVNQIRIHPGLSMLITLYLNSISKSGDNYYHPILYCSKSLQILAKNLVFFMFIKICSNTTKL